jgi:hypothetical protein
MKSGPTPIELKLGVLEAVAETNRQLRSCQFFGGFPGKKDSGSITITPPKISQQR